MKYMYATTIIAVLSIALISPVVNGRLLEDPDRQKVKENKERTSPQTRVVGGTIASKGEFPWFVAPKGYLFLCGGSLVYEDLVLSAAHCPFEEGMEVYVGALYRNSANGDAQKRTITKVLRHPDYSEEYAWNDVMLMKLDSPVENVEPIILNTNEATPDPGETLTAMGFGTLEDGGNTAYFLRKVKITAFDFQTCEDQYANVIVIDGGFMRLVLDEDVQICAGDRRGEKDTCQGDSGALLTFAGDSCPSFTCTDIVIF